MAYQTTEIEWHQGELAMHKLMSAPTNPNPKSPFLTPRGGMLIRQSPIEAVGLLDKNSRPWTTVWVGETGFSNPVSIGKESGQNVGGIVIQCPVDDMHDPVVNTIKENLSRGEKTHVSGLAINLMTRDRVKWAGVVLGADFKKTEEQADSRSAMMQSIVEVESSLMNCPKYLNKIPLKFSVPSPSIHSESTIEKPSHITKEAASLIASAPLCFLTTSFNGKSLSTNHRGGVPGFLRLILPDQLDSRAAAALPIQTQNPILVLPEYSGNRLYQSLGNLHETPSLGIAIPDFRNGDIFYATAHCHILSGSAAARVMPRTNLNIVMELIEWRLVKNSMGTTIAGVEPEEWESAVDWSPYNPPIRYLTVEQQAYGLPSPPPEDANAVATATLVSKTDLGPDIARFGFELSPARGGIVPNWSAGQYVVLDFNEEMSEGYSHMREDDPASLNDDLIRTFTVSSAPSTSEFEITIRNVGRCTKFLFRANVRAGMEFPVIAFGGNFILEGVEDERAKEEQAASEAVVGFIAGGIGITPLLAQMPELRQSGRGVRLWWGLRAAEMDFATKLVDAWKRQDSASGASATGEIDIRLFVPKLSDAPEAMQRRAKELEGQGVRIVQRRLQKDDVQGEHTRDIGRVFLCAGKPMTTAASQWLAEAGKAVVTESFAF